MDSIGIEFVILRNLSYQQPGVPMFQGGCFVRAIHHTEASVSGKQVFRKEGFLKMETNGNRGVGPSCEVFISGHWPFQARRWMILGIVLDSFIQP